MMWLCRRNAETVTRYTRGDDFTAVSGLTNDTDEEAGMKRMQRRFNWVSLVTVITLVGLTCTGLNAFEDTSVGKDAEETRKQKEVQAVKAKEIRQKVEEKARAVVEQGKHLVKEAPDKAIQGAKKALDKGKEQAKKALDKGKEEVKHVLEKGKVGAKKALGKGTEQVKKNGRESQKDRGRHSEEDHRAGDGKRQERSGPRAIDAGKHWRRSDGESGQGRFKGPGTQIEGWPGRSVALRQITNLLLLWASSQQQTRTGIGSSNGDS